jgi:hypothetical protein
MICTETSNAFDDGEHCVSEEDGPCAICRRKVNEAMEEAMQSYSTPLERLYDALDHDLERRKEDIDLMIDRARWEHD